MIRFALPLIAAALFANPAFAHTGHDHVFLFTDGLMHPLSGLDHIAAMLAVGLVAITLMPRHPIVAPLLFLAGLGGGALLARFGLVLPFFEQGILASLVVLGALAAFGAAVPVALGAGLLLIFGAAHGAAHGAEAPAGSFALYMAGFMLASAALHGAGLGLSSLALSRGNAVLVRAAGALTALLGLALAFGA